MLNTTQKLAIQFVAVLSLSILAFPMLPQRSVVHAEVKAEQPVKPKKVALNGRNLSPEAKASLIQILGELGILIETDEPEPKIDPSKIKGPDTVKAGGFQIYTYADKVEKQRWICKHHCVKDGKVKIKTLESGKDYYVDELHKTLVLATNITGTYSIELSGADSVREEKFVEIMTDLPPPDPGPTPTPTPVPVPVVDSPKNIVIFRETRDTTPEFGRAIVSLRNGPNADYLKSKNHSLKILDVDTTLPNGKQPQVIRDYAAAIGGMPLPVIVIVDPVANKIIHKQEIPVTMDAAGIIGIVKGHGG